MVHFSQALMSDVPLATSLPTTFTFQQNNQIDEQSTLQQQTLASSSHPQLSSSLSNQHLSPNDDRNLNSNNHAHTNDYETRLRCPNCETWVVNLSDHLRKTHRIASPVDRKPLLRMARLEKRRMTESASHSSTSLTTHTTTTTTVLKTQTSPALLVNGLPTTHTNTNEIENLLFKQEHDPNNFSVTLPENILLNQQITNSVDHFASTSKRQRDLDEHLEHTVDQSLSSNKKIRIGIIDNSKLSQLTHTSPNKTNKKNRNKQQPQTIIKTAASGIFPQQQQQQQLQQNITMQGLGESSDDLSKVLQMMNNEMNFLNQHLQTTTVLLQKQLDLARDSLHAYSVQFAHLKRMIQQQI